MTIHLNEQQLLLLHFYYKLFLYLQCLRFPLLSISAKIGFNPKFNTQLADAINDLGVTITVCVFF